jgi:AcrR family transcriptional regulator
MTSEERRAAILQAAVRLFAAHGFRGTTTRALAKAVGVTEPVLYEHFKSKHALYRAIIEAKSRDGLARGTGLLQPLAEAGDDRAFFRRLAEHVLECHGAQSGNYARLLLYAALEEPALGTLFHERQREGRDLVAGYIEHRIQAGVFRRTDSALAARAFLGMVVHLGLMELLYHDDFLAGRRQQALDGIVEIFLSGITQNRDGAR